MLPAALHDCLDEIGWTPDILARKLECHLSLVEAGLSGEVEISPKAAAWITALAAWRDLCG